MSAFNIVLYAFLLLFSLRSFAVVIPAGESCPERLTTLPPDEYYQIEMSPKYREEELSGKLRPVYYLSPEERQRLMVKVDDEGLVRDLDGSLVNVQNAIFVMDNNGMLYVDNIAWRKQFLEGTMGFHHSSIFGGAPVAMAGGITIINGKVSHISNASGHYKPGKNCIYQTIWSLLIQGVENSFTAEEVKAGSLVRKSAKIITVDPEQYWNQMLYSPENYRWALNVAQRISHSNFDYLQTKGQKLFEKLSDENIDLVLENSEDIEKNILERIFDKELTPNEEHLKEILTAVFSKSKRKEFEALNSLDELLSQNLGYNETKILALELAKSPWLEKRLKAMSLLIALGPHNKGQDEEIKEILMDLSRKIFYSTKDKATRKFVKAVLVDLAQDEYEPARILLETLI